MKIYFLALFFVSITFHTISAQDKTCKHQSNNSLTPTERIYGLSKFWSTANSHFVFMDKVDPVAWDSVYQVVLGEAIACNSDWEYYKLVEKLSAVLNDGHTGVFDLGFNPYTTDLVKPTDFFFSLRHHLFEEGVFTFREVENKIVLSQVSKSLENELPLASELLEVNNLPIEEYIIKYTLPYVSQSTPHLKRSESIQLITRGICGEKLNLKLKKKDGSIIEKKITFGGSSYPENSTCSDLMFDLTKDWTLLNLSWRGDIAIVELNSFGDPKIVEEFKAIVPELRKASAIVIDLRLNGGGSTNNGSDILEYLVSDQKLYGSRSETRQILPAFRAWGAYVQVKDTIGNEWATKSYLSYHNKLFFKLSSSHIVEVSVPQNERIIVPTAILIGDGTASAAEDFLIYADNQEHMIRVGEPSFGSTGQPIIIDLIRGLKVRICTKNDTYPDGTPFIGVGILPNIQVKPTLQDLLDKRDVVLETAIDYLNSKIKE